MEPARGGGIGRLMLLLDGALVLAAMGLSFLLHGALRGAVPYLKEPPDPAHYATLAYLVLPLWLALAAALGLHRVALRPPGRLALLWAMIKLHLAGLLGLTALLFLTQSVINRSLVVLFLGCSFCLLYLERSLVASWVRYQHRKGIGRLSLLLVGDPGPLMERFVRDADADPLPPILVGRLGDEAEAESEAEAEAEAEADAEAEAAADTDPPHPQQDLPPHLGALSDLPRVLHEQAVDRAIFFPPYNRPASAHDALDTCHELGVASDFVIDLEAAGGGAPRVEPLYGAPVICLDAAPRSAEALAVKQVLDIALALTGLLLLSPVLLLVSAAIMLSMGRPVLFTQRRSGLHGRPFFMLKFRTMVQGAEADRDRLAEAGNEMSGPVFKLKQDPRVTPLGKLLRSTSLDELPQLLNVLRGEMSLVGPRPLPVQEQQQIKGWQRRRLSMKPGITGIWQVSGRNAVDFEDWMRMDLEYVDSWSLRLDARLLLLTIPAVLTRRGAR